MPDADRSKARVSVIAIAAVGPAGEFRFIVTNKSSDFMHEMIVIEIKDRKQRRRWVAGDSWVNEDVAGMWTTIKVR